MNLFELLNKILTREELLEFIALLLEASIKVLLALLKLIQNTLH